MTANKQTLTALFQTGDVPQGTDYQNLIESNFNLIETSGQSAAGPLIVTELITPRVSATNINVTGTLSTVNFSQTNGTFSGTVSANIVNAGSMISTGNITANADVSANSGTVYASALRSTNGIFASVGIVSAAGTSQAAAIILTNIINRGQGVVDGATTGFAIPANRTGLTQYLLLETNTSANLWPPTGGQINSKTANTPFALAGQTSYTIFHVAASAYGVK